MTPIDALHVGQWIAITAMGDEEERCGIPLSYYVDSRTAPRRVNGRPLQIRAISLPFLCVSDGEHRFAIDVRTHSVTLLHRTYVKALRGPAAGASQFLIKEATPDRETTRVDARACPLCGEQLVERRYAGSRDWRLACRQCGFEGGASPRPGKEER